MVETELLAYELDLLDVVGRLAGAAEDDLRDVAGRDPHDEEDDGGGDQQRRHEEGQPYSEIAGHVANCRSPKKRQPVRRA